MGILLRSVEGARSAYVHRDKLETVLHYASLSAGQDICDHVALSMRDELLTVDWRLEIDRSRYQGLFNEALGRVYGAGQTVRHIVEASGP